MAHPELVGWVWLGVGAPVMAGWVVDRLDHGLGTAVLKLLIGVYQLVATFVVDAGLLAVAAEVARGGPVRFDTFAGNGRRYARRLAWLTTWNVGLVLLPMLLMAVVFFVARAMGTSMRASLIVAILPEIAWLFVLVILVWLAPVAAVVGDQQPRAAIERSVGIAWAHFGATLSLSLVLAFAANAILVLPVGIAFWLERQGMLGGVPAPFFVAVGTVVSACIVVLNNGAKVAFYLAHGSEDVPATSQ